MTIPIPSMPERPLQYIKAISNSNLPGTTRAVCWAIASFANNHTGRAFPSLAMLSKATTLSKAVISKHTALAESQGYLHKQKRFNNSLIYFITIPMSDEQLLATASANESWDPVQDGPSPEADGSDEPLDAP
jgi:DNA-binding transcriptional MocR family regulator